MVNSKTKIAIQGFPFDGNSSYKRGAAKAPDLIRNAFHNPSANYWSESGLDMNSPDIFVDSGNVLLGEDEDSFDLFTQSTLVILKQGLKPFTFGGDHSVTLPIIQAMAEVYPRLSILHFDAHPDLYEHYEGNYISHASPFARIVEAGLVERLVQVGIRTLTGQQREKSAQYGVEIHEMKDWGNELELTFETPLYISFDMDALDPAFAPGVSHLEPGGFSTRQVINIIQKLDAKIVGADIVEFNPEVESDMTAMVAAKMFKEIAAKMLEN